MLSDTQRRDADFFFSISNEPFLNYSSWGIDIQRYRILIFRARELEADTSRFRSLISGRIAQIESLTTKIGGGKYEDATKDFVAVLEKVNTEAVELEQDLRKFRTPPLV
ncbi:MAG: hypothetical protein Q9221_008370 [Calogaya cf. arnoldii]